MASVMEEGVTEAVATAVVVRAAGAMEATGAPVVTAAAATVGVVPTGRPHRRRIVGTRALRSMVPTICQSNLGTRVHSLLATQAAQAAEC